MIRVKQPLRRNDRREGATPRRTILSAPVAPNFSTASLLILLCSGLFFGACSSHHKTKVKKLDRHAIALHVQQAIERAGAPGIWIKNGKQTAARSSYVTRGEGLAKRIDGPATRSDAATEVLAVPAKFDAVVSAIKREAAKENLEAETVARNSRPAWRSVEIVLAGQHEVAGRWRVREVPKLKRATIVIDDLGQDLEAARQLIREPFPITFSVLPSLPHSGETAQEAHGAGREVMLHLPMEAGAGANAGPGKIAVGMRADEVARIIRVDLSSVPFAAGVNNHMGSRATANAALMAEVMSVLAQRRLYFIDSRTTAESTALIAARDRGVPAFYRSVFLDDTETVAYTLGQLREFRRVIEQQGVALAIGHPHATTIEALREFLPELERDDIQLVPASLILRLPEASRLEPPRRGANVAREKGAARLP